MHACYYFHHFQTHSREGKLEKLQHSALEATGYLVCLFCYFMLNALICLSFFIHRHFCLSIISLVHGELVCFFRFRFFFIYNLHTRTFLNQNLVQNSKIIGVNFFKPFPGVFWADFGCHLNFTYFKEKNTSFESHMSHKWSYGR